MPATLLDWPTGQGLLTFETFQFLCQVLFIPVFLVLQVLLRARRGKGWTNRLNDIFFKSCKKSISTLLLEHFPSHFFLWFCSHLLVKTTLALYWCECAYTRILGVYTFPPKLLLFLGEVQYFGEWGIITKWAQKHLPVTVCWPNDFILSPFALHTTPNLSFCWWFTPEKCYYLPW